MKAGKLSESVLKRSVLRQLHTTNENRLVSPAVGMDYGALRYREEEALVASTQTRVLGQEVLAGMSVQAAINNLVCSGVRPLGVTLSILVPTSCTEQKLRDWMQEISRICEREEVTVLGGHTEVVRGGTEPVLTVTAIGASRSPLIASDRVTPGMDLVLSKWIGLEGTVILAKQRAEELRTRYAQPFLDRAAHYEIYLSVRSEAAVAAQSGVAAMHDVSEGGIFGALWEMGQCSGVGLEIDLKKIPIRQETIEICEFFDLNPYKLLSGGSLLMASEDGNALVRALGKSGICATIIGKATEGNDRVLISGEERRFLETTQTDELWKLER